MGFYADSLKEIKSSFIVVSNLDKGGWGGSVRQSPGYYESVNLRNTVKEKGKVEFFKQLEKDLGSDIKISDPVIEGLNNYEQNVSLNYGIDLKTNDEDILYINPLFGEGYKKNPFNSPTRLYPVEMPYTTDEVYSLTLEVPNGYVLDEKPKSMKVILDEEGKSFFEYNIQHSDGVISLRSRIKISRAIYIAEEYDMLREFFSIIVTKQNEQLVFKKKK
jgi:hypothetical protein